MVGGVRVVGGTLVPIQGDAAEVQDGRGGQQDI